MLKFGTALLVVVICASSAQAATLTVCASGCSYTNSQFQAAINAANLGDTIVADAGVFYTGQFLLPLKSGDAYLTITTSANPALLPAEGQRTNPTYSAFTPKFCNDHSGPIFAAALGAHHYRFVNIEICSTYTSREFTHDTLVQTGSTYNNTPHVSTREQLPHHFIFDRVYIHGTTTGNVRRAFKLQTGAASVINSYIADVHEVGADSQGIWSSSGAGPFTIDNNYIEAAGENIMFGGADPPIAGLVVGDAAGIDGNTITRNVITKPLTWNQACVTGAEAGCGGQKYVGIRWTIKNHLEFKNGRNWLVRGNIFEHNWGGQSDQSGWSVILNPINQDGNCPHCTVDHVRFQDNLIRHVGSCFLLNASGLSNPGDTYTFTNNLCTDVDRVTWQGYTAAVLIEGSLDGLTFTHNTIDAGLGGADLSWLYFAPSGAKLTNLVIENNIGQFRDYGVIGDGSGGGISTLTTYAPSGYRWQKNALVRAADPGNYPPTTVFLTADVFAACVVNRATGNYRVVSTCPLKNAASDGTDIGVNQDAIDAAIGQVPVPTPIPIPTPTPTPTPTPPACTYTVTPERMTFTSRGGTNYVFITTQPGCGWSASSNQAWVNVMQTAGTGSATLTYHVRSYNGRPPRAASLMVGNTPIIITELGK